MTTLGRGMRCSRQPIRLGSPGIVAHSDDKRRARLNIITHLLSRIPYKEIERPKVKLPERQKRDRYKEPDYPYKMVPENF